MQSYRRPLIKWIECCKRLGMQENDLSLTHRLWLYSHSRLLKLHMAMHMPLHKLMPKLFAQPALFRAMMGIGSFR